MKVRLARSIKQPVLYSYFVSDFSQETLELFKESKPFTSYHKSLNEYEITREILEKTTETYSVLEQKEQLPVYERRHLEKYGYQQDAVEFSRKTRDVLLNFTQGMGKSLTTMRIVLDRNLTKVLIVCGQSNLQEEWVKDAVKHGLKETLNMRIVGDDTGAGNSKKAKWIKENCKVPGTDLINIEALRSEDIVAAVNAAEYDCIVVDEVQSAKGWKSQQTEGLHEIIRKEGQYRIALSGTPVLNDPLEFFSMLRYFGVLRDTARTTFEKYYGKYEFDYWGHYVCKGYKNLKDLVELMKPLICSADKGELGLPQKRRRLVNLSFTKEERERYSRLEAVYKMTTARMKKAGYSTKPQVRAEMQYMSAVAEQKISMVEKTSETTKVLVFSQYTTVLEKYRDALVDKGRKVLYYHGGLSMKERLNVLKDWRSGEYDVLLLSIMASRYGLNLTEASTVIFVDIPSSLAVVEQAEDRSHRIGQTKEVTSMLLSISKVDEDALELIERKQTALDELKEMLK